MGLRTRVRPAVVAAVAVALLAACSTTVAGSTAVTGSTAVSSPAPAAQGSTQCRRDDQRASAMAGPFTSGTRRVDVLGDSYSVGTDLTDPQQQAWPVLLARREGWQVRVRGVGGTGFTAGGACGNQQFASRVAAVLDDHPDEVIVEGGLNDIFDLTQVTASATAVLAAFPSSLPVVVIGPTAAPGRSLRGERAVDTLLARVCSSAHRQYISMIDQSFPFDPYRIHLTAAGYVQYADHVAEALG